MDESRGNTVLILEHMMGCGEHLRQWNANIHCIVVGALDVAFKLLSFDLELWLIIPTW